MTAPAKINFKIYQGSTFSHTLRWESDEKVYVPITGISRSAPVVITAPAHGAPKNWRVKVVGAGGMREINTAEYLISSEVTADTLVINSINAANYTQYTTGGVLEYNKPIDLSPYTAKMQIRTKASSDEVFVELTTENGGISIDNEQKTISIFIDSSKTATANFKTAVYSIELLDLVGETVTTFAQGTVTTYPEITR